MRPGHGVITVSVPAARDGDWGLARQIVRQAVKEEVAAVEAGAF